MSNLSRFLVNRGKPVAYVESGPYEGSFIGISNKPGSEYFGGCCDSCDIGDECEGRESISCIGGCLSPFPSIDEDQGERIYIVGPTGCGKSTYASKYIENFRDTFPDRSFILFSDVETDSCLDELEPIRPKMDDRLINITPDNLSNTICLFDDIEMIRDDHVRELVIKLRDSLLQRGRHNNIYVVCTSHLMSPGKSSKIPINDSSSITFFPSSGSNKPIRNFLRDNCGMGTNSINTIMKLRSRWITINKTYPMYVLYEKGCFLLDSI